MGTLSKPNVSEIWVVSSLRKAFELSPRVVVRLAACVCRMNRLNTSPVRKRKKNGHDIEDKTIWYLADNVVIYSDL